MVLALMKCSVSVTSCCNECTMFLCTSTDCQSAWDMFCTASCTITSSSMLGWICCWVSCAWERTSKSEWPSEIQFRSKHDYTSSYKVSGIPSYMSCYLAVSFYLICSLDLSAILYPGWWCDALMESTLYMPKRCIPKKIKYMK